MDRGHRRPWTVALGCAVSLAISAWDLTAATFDEDIVESPSLLALLLGLTAIPIIFTFAAFFRRNWGRIVLAVMTVLGIVSVPLLMLLAKEMAGPFDAESVLYMLADVTVVALLFVPMSNTWYREAHRGGIHEQS